MRNRRFKKFLSLLMAGSILTSSIGLPSAAESETELMPSEEVYTEAQMEQPPQEEPAVQAEEPAQEEASQVYEQAQEPAYEEPVYEEPAVQESTPQEPSYDYEEPAYQEPAYEEPAAQESAPQEPSYEEPSYQDPAYEEPAVQEPEASQEAPSDTGNGDVSASAADGRASLADTGHVDTAYDGPSEDFVSDMNNPTGTNGSHAAGEGDIETNLLPEETADEGQDVPETVPQYELLTERGNLKVTASRCTGVPYDGGSALYIDELWEFFRDASEEDIRNLGI